MNKSIAVVCGQRLNISNAATSDLAFAISFARSIRGKTHIVVDNSNIFVSGRDREFRVDYAAVQRHLSGDALLASVISVSLSPGENRLGQAWFYEWLRRTGWRVHTFTPIRDVNTGAYFEHEAHVDGDVRESILAAANSHDCESIVLMAGDGGFTNAVKAARRTGKQVFVIAWAGTLHPALAAAATATATIEQLRSLIGRVFN